MYGAATQLTGRQLGYVFIVLVALDWVASSYIVQNLERDAVQPFVITSICNSLLLLFLFAHWFHKWLRVSTSPLVFHYLGGLKRSLGAPPPGQARRRRPRRVHRIANTDPAQPRNPTRPRRRCVSPLQLPLPPPPPLR